MLGTATQPATAADEPIAYTSYAKFPQPGGTDYPYYATGKLYVSFPFGSKGCSASAIASENQSVFVTAAHCLYDFPTRTWGSNTMFVLAKYYGRDDQYHMMGYPAEAWGGERLMNCDSKIWRYDQSKCRRRWHHGWL